MAAEAAASDDDALVVMFPSPLVTWLYASYGDEEDGPDNSLWLELTEAQQEEAFRGAVQNGYATESAVPNLDTASDEPYETLYELTDSGEAAAAELFERFGN